MYTILKHKLVIVYSFVTSVILIVILIALFRVHWVQRLQQEEHTYEESINSIYSMLSQTKTISSSWLEQMETQYHLQLVMKENNIDLHLRTNLVTNEELDVLVSKLTSMASKDSYDLNLPIFTNQQHKSKVYRWHTNQSTYYRGSILQYRMDKSLITLYIMEIVPNNIVKECCPYILSGIIGIVLLLLFNYLFIKHLMHPIEQGHKQQQQFIASVSHELKSPLAVISLGVKNLRDELSSHTVSEDSLTQCRKFLPAIESECQRATRLINDMLLLAAVDTKTWQLHKEEIDMDLLLMELYDRYSSVDQTLSKLLTFDLSQETLYRVYGDKERIVQIITILLDNANHYNINQEPITLRAYNQDSLVHIEVQDHGPGIPDDKKPLVFQRFYQLNSAQSDKQNFGLGLSIAYELTTLHNGHLTVKDTVPHGSTFCLTLPRYEKEG